MKLGDKDFEQMVDLASRTTAGVIESAGNDIQRAAWYVLQAEQAMTSVAKTDFGARLAAVYSELAMIATVLDGAADNIHNMDEAYSE